MGFAVPLVLGFLASSLGIAPPGLLNMTAAKVSIKEGQTRALVFAAGASLVVILQAFIAVLFAQFIDDHPEIILMLREVGVAIFIALTIYFFATAKKVKPEKKDIKLHSKKSRFFFGMLLSALNFFPIPFYVFASITLASYNYFLFERFFIYTFVVGAGIGAFSVFYFYIKYFKKEEHGSSFIMKNMNYIIGCATGIISVLTLINIFGYYFK